MVRPGAARKCQFYDELVRDGHTRGTEYVCEEILDCSGNHLITWIQEENRPSILDCVGKVFYIEEIDPDHTMLTVHHYYRPKNMPLTRLMATNMMKKPVQKEAYMIAWGIMVRKCSTTAVVVCCNATCTVMQYHCETGKVAKLEMVPDLIGFKEVEDIYDI